MSAFGWMATQWAAIKPKTDQSLLRTFGVPGRRCEETGDKRRIITPDLPPTRRMKPRTPLLPRQDGSRMRANAAASCLDGMREKSNFANPIRLMLPVQSPRAKINRFLLDPNQPYNLRYPVPQRGALAIVTNVGTGCGGRGSVGRGTWSQGGVFRERSKRARRTALDPASLMLQRVCTRRSSLRANTSADGKTVWSWHPLLVSRRRRFCGPNRDSRSHSTRRRR
jgi:hypothetical protein